MKTVLGVLTLLAAGLFVVPVEAVAAAPGCTITGSAGDDVITGTRHDDVICALGGADLVRGRGGNDVVYGGGGPDRLFGGGGSDRLLAGAGEDHLDGERGADVVDGEEGAGDWCLYHWADRRRSCTWDVAPPELVEFEALPPVIDVSSGAKQVTLRVHLRDDAGIARVQGYLHDHKVDGSELWQSHYERTSGNLREGWWEFTETVPELAPVSDLKWTVAITDVKGRWTNSDTLDVLHVANDHPDPAPPQVTILSPVEPQDYDVRDGSRRVAVTVQVVDPDSGLAINRYFEICGERIGCDETPRLLSGTRWNGIWRGVLTIPEGTKTGDMSFYVLATDRARPDAWLIHVGDNGYVTHRYLSGGGVPEFHLSGSVIHRIQGPEEDVSPTFGSLSIEPHHVVRTLAGSPVEFTVTAEGASRVDVLLFHEGTTGPWVRRIPLALEGGVWRATWLVKNTPEYWLGDYHPVVRIADHDQIFPTGGHVRYAAAAGANTMIGTHFPELEGDPVLTVSDPG